MLIPDDFFGQPGKFLDEKVFDSAGFIISSTQISFI